MRRSLALVLSIMFSVAATGASVFAQEKEDTSRSCISVHGYLKSLSGLQFADDIDSAISSSLLHNRLNVSLEITPALSATLGVRTRIFYGEDVKVTPSFATIISSDPGFFDLSVLWLNSRSVVIHSIADRAYLRYADDSWDVRLGRQRINWGIATIWNPNDLFNAYNILDFDYEERPGSDAIRAQYSPATNTTIEAAFSPSRTANDAVGAGIVRWNMAGYDVQALAGIYKTDLVAGIGWAGNIGEAGFKGELSYFHPRKKEFDSSDAIEISLSADHMIGEYYLMLSGLYNSSIPNDAAPVAALFSRLPSPKNLMPFRYSLYGSVAHSFSPICSATIALIYSPNNNSTIFFPVVTYSLAEDIDADLIAESYFSNAAGSYRSLANVLFLRLRWSF